MNLMINYSHKWWYKALTILLILALLVMITLGAAPKAKAIGVLTLTVCAAILAVMAGAGIATVVSGMTSADIQSWLNGKLNEWDTYRNDGNVFTDLINGNLITATVKGTLAIGNAAASGISDFINWLKSDLSITDNSYTSIITPSATLDNIQGNVLDEVLYYTYYSGQQRWYVHTFDSSIPVFVFWAKTDYYNTYRYYLYAYSESPFTVYATYEDVPQANGYKTIQNNDSRYMTILTNYVYDSNATNPYTNAPSYLDNYVNGWGLSQWNDYLLNTAGSVSSGSGTLSLDTDVINIPDVSDPSNPLIVIGIDGAYPGVTTEEITDVIMEGVETNTLDVDMDVTEEITDAQEVYVINEQPISVNTDHHMIGFTNLPDFQGLNLNSIWHYVSDAVEYAAGFISWFVNLITAVPVLAIPLYMSFTLLIVLSFIRRILL